MAYNQEWLHYIYRQIYAIKPINCIFKEKHCSSYISVEKDSLPKVLKDKEQESIQYFVETVAQGEKKSGYAYENSFCLRYLGVGIYEEEEYIGHIILGPYLSQSYPGTEWAYNILEKNNLEIGQRRKILEIYEKLTVITILEEIAIVNIIHALWRMGNINIKCFAPIEEKKVEKLEKRYDVNLYEVERMLIRRHHEAEKKMIYYISQGDEKRAIQALTGLNASLVRKFKQNPIRNFKNLILTLNGRIRGAIQSQPIDITKLYHITSEIAVEIEECTSMGELQRFLKNMIRVYCDLINATKNIGYSSLISNAVQYIRCNFEEEINLKRLAGELYVHPNYLSRKFKEETGYQLSDYINKVRVEQAQLLLNHTDLTITDIAYTVGYNDEKYFSKVFKKMHQKTPREYRSS